MPPWLGHGGRLDAARAAFPQVRGPWIDLSTGINPLPWDAGGAGPIDWARLPGDAALAGLESAAAGFFGVAADRVCAVPGTEIGLRLLATLDLPRPYRHVEPGYRTHRDALGASRAIRPDAVEAEAAHGGTILLANPANPTGAILARPEVQRLSGAIGARGGMLVIDEAFADVDPTISLLGDGQDDATIVLRSFGKFFGLAGVRLGFVVAAPAMIARVRRRLGSWPVSAAAIAIGAAAYRDAAWIAAARDGLATRAAQLDALLRRHGLEGTGECPLMRLVISAEAAAVFDRLARHGILTRPFADRPAWLRFGLPGDEGAFQRLDTALGDA